MTCNNLDEKKEGEAGNVAYMLKSGDKYVLPGSSIKGVLRHQAGYILKRIGYSEAKAKKMLDNMMGSSEKGGTKTKSRLVVDESYLNEGVKAVMQTRNRIDRFTGGAIKGALLSVPTPKKLDLKI